MCDNTAAAGSSASKTTAKTATKVVTTEQPKTIDGDVFRDNSNKKSPRSSRTSSTHSSTLDESNTSRTTSNNNNVRNSVLRRSGTVDWRFKKDNLTFSQRFRDNSPGRRHAEIDDEEGKAQFFLTLLFQRYVCRYIIICFCCCFFLLA